MLYSPLEQFEILYILIPKSACFILNDNYSYTLALNFITSLQNNYFLLLTNTDINFDSYEEVFVDFNTNNIEVTSESSESYINFLSILELLQTYQARYDIQAFFHNTDIFSEFFHLEFIESYKELIQDSDYNIDLLYEGFLHIFSAQDKITDEYTTLNDEDVQDVTFYMIRKMSECDTCFSDDIYENVLTLLIDIDIPCMVASTDLDNFVYNAVYDDELAFSYYTIEEVQNLDFYSMLNEYDDILVDECLINVVYYLDDEYSFEIISDKTDFDLAYTIISIFTEDLSNTDVMSQGFNYFFELFDFIITEDKIQIIITLLLFLDLLYSDDTGLYLNNLIDMSYAIVDESDCILDLFEYNELNNTIELLDNLNIFFDESDSDSIVFLNDIESYVYEELTNLHLLFLNEVTANNVTYIEIFNNSFFFAENITTNNLLAKFIYYVNFSLMGILHPIFILFGPISTNLLITLSLLSCLIVLMFLLFSLQFFLIPRNSHLLILYYYSFIKSIIVDLIAHFSAKQYYFQLIAFLFIVLNILNLYGLIPYTFVLTSQFSFTFFCSFIFFTALNFTGITVHGLTLFSLFFPSGAPIFIAPLLVIIEFISYFARVFSLAIRLFANITAGHILLKILSWFTWSMLDMVFASIVSTLIITVLWILEFFISVLQAYVFTILICIYLNDVLNLH